MSSRRSATPSACAASIVAWSSVSPWLPEQGIGGHIDGETDHGCLETGIGVMLVFHGIDQGRGESPAPKDESADFGMVSGDQFEFEFTGRNPGSAQRSG